MKPLTINQPFETLISKGTKNIESRITSMYTQVLPGEMIEEGDEIFVGEDGDRDWVRVTHLIGKAAPEGLPIRRPVGR